MVGNVWEGVSDSAKDLINKMLKYSPDERISAQEAYSHPWLANKRSIKGKPRIIRNIMANLKNFHVLFCVIS